MHDITPFVSLLVVASLVAMVAQRVRVPYALALVVTGLLVGAPHLLPEVHLEPHVLFTVFLPPLIFESSMNIRADLLRKSWRPIAVFALVGTLLSAGIVGGLANSLLGLPLTVALVFGALISPTDPISVIALFQRLGVGKRLALIVEAESLFNDGVAVVIFSLLMGVAAGGSLSAAESGREFVVVILGGAGVGLGIGGLASRVTRQFDDHLLEIMLTTIVAYGSYLLAETLHVSGVIAVVAAGLMVGNYGMLTGMSPTTRLAVTSFWEYAAFAANSIVFLLVGIEVTFFNLWSRLGPILGAVVIVLAGRAAAIYGLSLVVNRFGGEVPFHWQHVLVWGGVRGALSMALVLGLPREFPERESVVGLTFGVVLFSLLAQGLTVETLLKRLKLVRTKPSDYLRLSGELAAARAAASELDRVLERGLLPRGAVEPLRQEYRGRIGDMEAGMESMHVSDSELGAQQTREARRLALAAERSALRDSWRAGLLDDEDLRRLEERIDGQLAALQEGHAAGEK